LRRTGCTPPADTTIIALAYAGSAATDSLPPLAEAKLARYKQPRAYVQLDALPRSPNGKLDRRALAGLVRKALA
jgi:acyl-CoA synthetase (AMP-forming)/AMP-acid ligase II